MRIGTTPTHTFMLPADIASTVAKVRVIYSQYDKAILTKDVTALNDKNVVLKLTQEETLKFSRNKNIEIQLRILTKGGEAMTSDIIIRKPYECLENGVFA